MIGHFCIGGKMTPSHLFKFASLQPLLLKTKGWFLKPRMACLPMGGGIDCCGATPSPSDPILLFTDGHSSRYTLATIAKARAKGIVIYVIPPHATHFMCVTDKTCHSPYQKRYAALKRVHESTHSTTTWANYVGLSSRAYVESFTPSNLINGFRATGLWPINAMEPLMAMVQPDPFKKKEPRGKRASKRKLDLALFDLPMELQEKKRSLGPVARVKVFGGCLSGDDVFEQFQSQQKERDEKDQRALARESALAMGRDMRENFFEEFTTKFKEAQVEWTAWKKANVPRAPRRTYTRRTPTTATSTPTTSLPQATSTPSTSMPLPPNDPLLQALTMPPILPSSSLPVMQLDNSYMDPFGTSMFNMSMGGMPLLPTVLPSTMQPGMPLPPLPMDPLVPLCAPLDGSFGAFGTTPMVLDSNSMAPSLPLLY